MSDEDTQYACPYCRKPLPRNAGAMRVHLTHIHPNRPGWDEMSDTAHHYAIPEESDSADSKGASSDEATPTTIQVQQGLAPDTPTETSQQRNQTEVKPPSSRRTRRSRAALALGACLAVALLATNLVLWNVFLDLNNRVDELESGSTNNRLVAVENDLANTITDLSDLNLRHAALGTFRDSVATSIDGLEGQLDDLRGAPALTPFNSPVSSIRELEDEIQDLRDEMRDLTDCINAYMRIVGNSGGGFYTYRFC